MAFRFARVMIALCLASVGAAAPEGDAAAALAKRGEPCQRVREVIEAVGRQGDPHRFCDHYKPRGSGTTVLVTKTRTKTETVYTTVAVRQPTCGRQRRDEDAFLEIEARDPAALPRLPASLEKYGPEKVQKACHCLPKPAQRTVTKTVDVTETATRTKTKTVCETCLAKDQPCDINDPGACCNQTCGVVSWASGFYCY